MWIAAGLTTFWTALGSFVAVFPGMLESLFGIDYDFKDDVGRQPRDLRGADARHARRSSSPSRSSATRWAGPCASAWRCSRWRPTSPAPAPAAIT